MFGMTIGALAFAGATALLFAWGLGLGLAGIKATHPAFGEGGYDGPASDAMLPPTHAHKPAKAA